MGLKRVTITGADDFVRPMDLVKLTDEFPFVEWGILLSESSTGKARFPSMEWMEVLGQMLPSKQLSGHICGKWMRDICKGNWTILQSSVAEATDMFDRFQLNFSPYVDKIKDVDYFFSRFGPIAPSTRQFILQLRNPKHDIVVMAANAGIDAVPLFDISGGKGIVPKEWPKNDSAAYTGYAGGLRPENLRENLDRIFEAAEGDFWIDTETGVRDDDNIMDLAKVREFLEIAKEYVDV